MAIELGKTYRTRDGREAIVYATNGAGDYPVHGAHMTVDGWHIAVWTADGFQFLSRNQHDLDLIEVKPRIKRELWVNLYPSKSCVMIGYETKDQADKAAAYNRIACIPIIIDCEEGEGL